MDDALWMLASSLTCAQVLIGLPIQIRKVVERKSAADFAPATLALSAAGFCGWAVAACVAPGGLGFINKNSLIFVPNAMGGVLTLALLALALSYGKGGGRGEGPASVGVAPDGLSPGPDGGRA